MQPLKQRFLRGYTTKETICAYLVTGWFAFGAFLFYLTMVQPWGKNPLPELFYLVVLSLVMVGTFPFFSIVWNGFNGIGALFRHEYGQATFSFGLALGVLLAWYVIRYALYGKPRRFTVPAP